jgi:hypothetical protein
LERRARGSSRQSAFSLVGSATLNVAPRDVLKDVRIEQDLLGDKKLVSVKAGR